MRLLPALLAAAVLAGCGGSDADDPEPVATGTASGNPSATPTTSPAPAGTATVDPVPGAGTEPVGEPAENTEVALLTAVRAARQEGFDRLVFEFRNGVPGYQVGFVEKAVADGSGETVDVNGEAILQIRMENALDADLSDPDAPPTYEGPRRFETDTTVIAEAARTGGFEGVLTWVAGLRVQAPFRVTTLEDPSRLVVDVRTP